MMSLKGGSRVLFTAAGTGRRNILKNNRNSTLTLPGSHAQAHMTARYSSCSTSHTLCRSIVPFKTIAVSRCLCCRHGRQGHHVCTAVLGCPGARMLYQGPKSQGQEDPSSPGARKNYRPVHPTVLQRLSSVEDNMRFHGYSTIRIGAAVILVIGCSVFLFREHIRENVAGEVSTVATMSLDDMGVQMKVQELALALVHVILTNEKVQNNSVTFLKDVFEKPATKQALVTFLIQILLDPTTVSQLLSTMKHVIHTALSDDVFRAQLAHNLKHLMQEDGTREGLLELVKYILRDEQLRAESEKFMQEVLASDRVKAEAGKLGKKAVHDIVSDIYVQKKTGDAMWSAFTYSVTPRIFDKKGSKKKKQEEKKKEEDQTKSEAKNQETEDKSDSDGPKAA